MVVIASSILTFGAGLITGFVLLALLLAFYG
jgi:hypothetical protein